MTIMDIVHTFYKLLFLSCWILLQTKVNCQGETKFLKEPQDATVKAGSPITLPCQVDNPKGAVQWTRDEFAMGTDRGLPGYPRYMITGSEALGEYNLLITNAQLEDDANFQCQIGAADGFSGLMSQKAKLTVLIPPIDPLVIENAEEVAINAWKLNVVAGTKTNITCLANDGKPAATITWFMNGVEVTSNTYYFKADPDSDKKEDATGLLEFTPTRADQDKLIECKATNAALNLPRQIKARLEVLYAPEITMLVEPRNIREGGRQKIKCEGKGNPPTVTWKWYLGDTVIDGETQNTLTLTNIMRDKHGQTVSCEGTNAVGSVKHAYTMSVEYGPKFLGEPKHVAVSVGEDAELHCDVDGNPTPAIIWTKKASPRMLGSSDKLRITDVNNRDFGPYTCTATVIGFMEVQRDVHLLQKGSPTVLSESEQFAVYNDDAELECVVRSVPKPTELFWSRDGQKLDISTLKRYQLIEEDLVDGKKSRILINQVQDQDFGTYNCTVVNEFGSDTLSIQFLKKETIPAWVIALGVVLGFLFIVLVAVGLFMWYRKKHGGSEYGSDSSENTLQKKDKDKDKQEETPPQFKDTVYGGPIDAFGSRYSPPEYDELNNYAKQPNQGQDLRDGGYGGYNQRTTDPYGTFPRPANNIYDSRYAASDYGPITEYSHYGTYGRARQPNYAASDYGVPSSSHNHFIPPQSNPYGTLPPPSTVYPPPPANLDSRLATNV